MAETINLNGKDYDIAKLTTTGKKTLEAIAAVDNQIRELNNIKSVFERARKGFINDLRNEILAIKSGIDFSATD